MRKKLQAAAWLFLLVLTSCPGSGGSGGGNGGGGGGPIDPVYRQHMREFVQAISAYARGFDPGFIVIPQNGQELLVLDYDTVSVPAAAYLAAIDGQGREDLFYGYDSDNKLTPLKEREYMMRFLDFGLTNGVNALVTDYCWDHARMDNSYAWNQAAGYISFAAPSRGLDLVPAYPPAPHNGNTADITSLGDVRNFLYLIDPGGFPTKADFLNAVIDTDYDLLLIDLFFDETTELTAADVDSLKIKKSGGARLVVAYMSIGEAEDYRYYWDPSWKNNPPDWLARENPNWPGNYKVRYWDPEWQAVIYGSGGSYVKKILDAHFDGVYLDLIDAFEYFE